MNERFCFPCFTAWQKDANMYSFLKRKHKIFLGKKAATEKQGKYKHLNEIFAFQNQVHEVGDEYRKL